MTTTSIENHTLERLIDAWDTTVLPKHNDGAMQEWMESLRHEFMTCKQNAMNELTDEQIRDILRSIDTGLYDGIRAVIAADRAMQAAEIERLRADADNAADTAVIALRKAWQLGQTYWQQADSEYTSQHAKADMTQQKFKKLCDETSAAMKGATP